MKTPLEINTVIPTPPGTTLGDVQALLVQRQDPRFEKAIFQNRSSTYVLVLALYQGHDERGEELLPGYVLNTGVTVGATELSPGGETTSHVQSQINCWATRAEANYRWRHIPTGYEGVNDFPDIHSNNGNCLTWVRWWINEPSRDAKTLQPTMGFEIIGQTEQPRQNS